ncbi:hypothetical protein ABT112_01810 [Streptomyces sp. NPDC002055]|uniref:hypothetical protein n=1 Tax=Streptomyces sp. NPDC002055 TaxID=3154534 RepID=UPI0033219B22
MRTARTVFASAAITVVLAVTGPAANAVTLSDDGGRDSESSSSREHDGDHEKSWEGRKPHGGVHTGGGALALSSMDDEDHGKQSRERGDHEKSWEGRKPHGGMHTGGGALAATPADDWDQDGGSSSRREDSGSSSREDSGSSSREDSGSSSGRDRGEESRERGDHEKSWEGRRPHGGVHTGGGGLAESGGGLAAGSALALGGIGAGAYMLRRRRNAAGDAAA